MDRTLIADRGDATRRLDLVLRRRLADVGGISRARIQQWIEHGRVTVNGRPAGRVAARLAAGDVITIAVGEVPARRVATPENAPVDILFEDAHLVAVNKPAGLIVHPAYKHARGTLLNALLWHTRDDPGGRPALVGRLDKLTSGIVIAAKTTAVYAPLQRALASGAKQYLAVVYGRVNVSRGTIDLPLGRDVHDRRRVIVSTTAARRSVTRFERVARIALPDAGLSLLRCELVTGRMHQIRVHLAARGWPIVGDPVYGEARWQAVVDAEAAAALRAFPRQALHAFRVEFDHPITGEPIRICAPLPEDFVQLLRVTGFDPRLAS